MNADSQPAGRTMTSLSVFFPCYNEAQNIQRVVTRAREVLAGVAEDWEIIIVDDGSRDGTAEIADGLSAADDRVRVVHHPKNGGYGMALRSGFEAARKEYVFFTDGDGQFDVAEIKKLLEHFGGADIICGYRRNRQDNLIRRINAACWGWLVQRMLRFRCRDVDGAFKLFKREIFDHITLKSTGALISAEILSRATRAGYSMISVPVSHFPRAAGKATGARPGVILRAFKELMKLRKDILSTPCAPACPRQTKN